MAGKWLAANFNQPDATLFDYDVYAICGDGDMMEGVASEAASLRLGGGCHGLWLRAGGVGLHCCARGGCHGL